jgi:hypothetical protein
MTISEIAAELRVALGNCVDAKEGPGGMLQKKRSSRFGYPFLN